MSPGPTDPFPSDPAANTLADATKLRAQLNALFTYLTGNVDRDAIKDGEVTSAELAASAVTAPKIGALPSARAFHNANQGIAGDGLSHLLAFNSERFDSDTIHDTVTNNSRLTCKTAGLYVISATVQWANALGNYRAMYITLNGGNAIAYDERSVVGTYATVQTVSTLYRLVVNDYVEVQCAQDSGGSVNIVTAANYSPEFSMAWIGP